MSKDTKKFLSLFILLFGFSFTFSPSLAAALTSDQIQAIIALVRSFGVDESMIKNVDDSLNGRTPTATSPTVPEQSFCYTFNRYLVAGNTGADTQALQKALNKEGIINDAFEGLHGTADQSTFDDDTAAAVVQFQGKYGITQTGTVGPRTRAKLNQLYGCGASVTRPIYTPAVSTQSTPSVSSQPSITVLSPNGGERYKSSDQITVSWKFENLPGVATKNPEIVENVSINVYSREGKGCRVAAIPVTSGSYPINVSDKQGCYPLVAGEYRIYLEVGLQDGATASDYSNGYFTITAPTTTTQLSITSAKVTQSYLNGGYAGIAVELSGTNLFDPSQVTSGGPIKANAVYLGGENIGPNLVWAGRTTSFLQGLAIPGPYKDTFVVGRSYAIYVENSYGRSNVVYVTVAIAPASTTPTASNPTISSLSVPNGAPGSELALYGSGFDSNPTRNRVDFSSQTDTSQTARVTPYAANSEALYVRVPNLPVGQYKLGMFTIDDRVAQTYPLFTITASTTSAQTSIMSVPVCSTSVSSATIGQRVPWSVSWSGGKSPYRYSFRTAGLSESTDGGTPLTYPGFTNETAYTIDGVKSAAVTITDATGYSVSTTCSNSVTVTSTASNQPSITVLSPNGGQRYSAGQSIPVTWQPLDIPSGTPVTITVVSDSRGVVAYNNSDVVNSRSSSVVIPTSTRGGDDYRVVVGTSFAHDKSDSTFTITAPTTTSSAISVVRPDEGENWRAGSTQTISWNAKDGTSSTVLLELRKDSLSYIMIFSAAPNTGSYSWTIPSGLAPGSYSIRITDQNNRSVYDDNSFYILAPASSY